MERRYIKELERLTTKASIRETAQGGKTMKINCTASNSSLADIHNNPQISHIVEATKREHELFCYYVGTDIFVHD